MNARLVTPAEDALGRVNPAHGYAELPLLRSRDNPLLLAIRKLAADPGGYRRQNQIWLEGDHLVRAALSRGWSLKALVLSQAGFHHHANEWRAWAGRSARSVVVADDLFAGLSGLESPSKVGALVQMPEPDVPLTGVASLVLDRLQDAGNVGSILRSAAAFGVQQVLAMKGTAGLWSPKVLRAGMGAHFGLRLIEGLDMGALDALSVPLLATSSHGGLTLGESDLPQPCAWVLGHEGQGVSAPLMARCHATVCIPQPGGEESLNVAAAAAICLFSTRTV